MRFENPPVVRAIKMETKRSRDRKGAFAGEF